MVWQNLSWGLCTIWQYPAQLLWHQLELDQFSTAHDGFGMHGTYRFSQTFAHLVQRNFYTNFYSFTNKSHLIVYRVKAIKHVFLLTEKCNKMKSKSNVHFFQWAVLWGKVPCYNGLHIKCGHHLLPVCSWQRTW